MPHIDVIVVGSGPSGVAASWGITRAGASVTMLDGGLRQPTSGVKVPEMKYAEFRRNRSDQWEWFLGQNFAGVCLEIRGPDDGGQALEVIPGLAYVTEQADRLLPIAGENISVLQSLAAGGMASNWSGTCAIWAPEDLRSAGLPPDEMMAHYQSVCDRIGVSGTSERIRLMPPAQLDLHGKRILETAARKTRQLAALGVTVEQPPLAVLTVDRGSRKACNYSGLEPLLDARKCIWRPPYGLEELEAGTGFQRLSGLVAERIEEGAKEVVVHCRRVEGDSLGSPLSLRARHVVLAAGTLPTARILLASTPVVELPLLAKTSWISACVHLRGLNVNGSDSRMPMCQVVLRSDRDGLECSASLGSRWALLTRLLASLPAPVPEALGLLALLSPRMVMADYRFAVPTSNARVRLDGKRLVVRGCPAAAELADRERGFSRLERAVKTLGLKPLRVRRLGEGATWHYGGTVPHNGDGPLTVDERGLLNGTRRTWVADASVLRSLPSVSPTLTAMANAERIGTALANELSKA